MENNTPSQPPFFINQRVVALSNQPDGLFKKGEVFPVTEIRKSQCKCHGWEIRIGDFIGFGNGSVCTKCWIWVSTSGILWFDAARFAPYNPPRHESVEIAEDILQIKIVEERSDVITEKILND